jgi:hypothetical protein
MPIKKCKGTGKAKGYGCGIELKYTERNGLKSYNAKYGLGLTCCYAKWLSGSDEGKALIQRATLKASKDRLLLESEQKQRKKTKETKTLGADLEATQKIVNKYIRLRDIGKPCASSKVAYRKNFDAGHVYPVKQFSALRFDYDNIHGQSQYANRYLQGDYHNYLINLPNIIGKERAESLKKRAELCKKYIKKWTRHELKEIRKDANLRIKNLKP